MEAAREYAIAAVDWLDLRDPNTWDAQVRQDTFISSTLQRVRAALGYLPAESSGR